MNRPFVSIIIVNYNGRNLLSECLSSVLAISYPSKKYEVIVVDNASSDDSVTFVRKTFPSVSVVASDQNLGFTGGNSLGLQYAKGEYVVLLNSDTRVDSQWLRALVEAAEDRSVGIVNSKLFFATPFLELKLESSVVGKNEVTDSADFSPLGVLIEPIVCPTKEMDALVWYKSGFYEGEKAVISSRWTKGTASILLPYRTENDSLGETYLLTLHGHPTYQASATTIQVSVGNEVVLKDSLNGNQVKQYTLKIVRKREGKDFLWLVQNAGNIVLQDGYGKDRGSVSIRSKREVQEHYELDHPVFHKQTELLSACGASCLIKKQVIRDIGFFDPMFFMYYEDQDFSVRAWRKGWKILYEPRSIVFHKHRATTGKDVSAFFLEHVEKNHLLFLLKHFPLSIFYIEFTLFMIRFSITWGMMIVFRFLENIQKADRWERRFFGRKAALLFIIRNLQSIRNTRVQLERDSVRGYQEMHEYLY